MSCAAAAFGLGARAQWIPNLKEQENKILPDTSPTVLEHTVQELGVEPCLSKIFQK